MNPEDNRSVRRMEQDDLDATVRIHLEAFHGFFLSFLGYSFLKELYRSILKDPSGIAWVAIYDNKIVGFVLGSDQPVGLYKRLLFRRWWRFGIAAIPAFLRKPTILPRLLRAFAKPRDEMPTPDCGTLMSIAVDPCYQNKRIGKMLIDIFIEDAAQRGLMNLNLSTDARENDAANRFYQSIGFNLRRTYITPEGRLMNEYLKPID